MTKVPVSKFPCLAMITIQFTYKVLGLHQNGPETFSKELSGRIISKLAMAMCFVVSEDPDL